VISLKDKREMRRAAQEMRRTAASVPGPVQSVQTGEIVVPLLRLLERAAPLLGDREPSPVAGEFFDQFPVKDQRMTARLESSVAGAALLWEIYRIWEHRRAKAV
jgi:hypothetical protein